MRGLFNTACCIAAAAGSATLIGNTCVSGSADQAWIYDATSGALQTLTSVASGTCLTPDAFPIVDGTSVSFQPCDVSNAGQSFLLQAANNTIVAASDPSKCLNLAAYGTSPGTQIWLFTCSQSGCKGNCDWISTPAANASDVYSNPESGLCMDDNLGPPPPHTCSPGSPSAGLPFCDASLPFTDRVTDLLSRLSLEYKQALFSNPIQPAPYNASLNLKSFYWDITCIHGLAPGTMTPEPNVTVFPHAIAQAASWDVDLISRVSAATATEGRVVNQINYAATGGTTYQAVHCDGGPLANSVHDPRWGRTSETYGEDPALAATIGVVATLTLQNRSTAGFMQTSQVTRHYLGYHQAGPDIPTAEEFINPQWLHDAQLPIYQAVQTTGMAEGIMCAIASMASDAWNGTMVPSCVNDYLLTTQLRQAWNSSAFIQSDCCDSITAMVDVHHYYATLEEAVAGAMTAGLSASFGNAPGITAALQQAMIDGTVSQALLDERIGRNLLTRFRLGEFDTDNPANPFRGPYDESILDGAVNRALAREAMAKSVVLLENRAGLLPLAVGAAGKKIAVIGPLADCASGSDQDAPLQCSYLHSYNGQASYVNTILDALREEAANGTSIVAYSQGTNIVSALSASGIADAVELAAGSDLTFIVVGLTALIEAEGNDRTYLTLPPIQQQLLVAVSEAAGADKVVLVLVSANAVDFDPALASTVLQAWYGGEETGHGLLDVITGRVPPSGRMPLTTYQDSYLNFVNPITDFNMVSNGTGRTYRFYNGTLINYKFGYGLRYTSVNYTGASVVVNADGTLSASVVVTNTGGMDSDEIVQLYVTVPSVAGVVTPIFSLQAFAKVHLPVAAAVRAGTAAPQLYSTTAGVYATAAATVADVTGGAQVSFTLTREQMMTTLVDGTRVITPGTYTIHMGGHLPGDVKGDASANVLSVPVQYS